MAEARSLISDHDFRNITRIHLQLEADSIRLMRSGNSENSMSFPICLKDDLTEATKLPRNTLISSPKSVLLSSCGECFALFLILPWSRSGITNAAPG